MESPQNGRVSPIKAECSNRKYNHSFRSVEEKVIFIRLPSPSTDFIISIFKAQILIIYLTR